MFAVLEHMTLTERLTTLKLALEVTTDTGAICVFETPNRLLWWDYHTSEMPFFSILPDELALMYLDRSARDDLKAAFSDESDALDTVKLARWGRGVSHHEFELVFGSLSDRIIAGGYDAELLPTRHVHRDELYLSRFFDNLGESRPAPPFSRYYLDFILSKKPLPASSSIVRPWPFSTDESCDVAFNRWETLTFQTTDAWLRVPASGAKRLILGVDADGPVEISVETAAGNKVLTLPCTAGAPTRYSECPLDEGAFVLRTNRPCQVAFIGTAN